MNSTTSQTKQIENWLIAGNSITPMLALKKFGCFRLGARIWDIKKSGLEVKSKLIHAGKKHWSMYFIIEP